MKRNVMQDVAMQNLAALCTGVMLACLSCTQPVWAAQYQADLTHTSVYFGVSHFARSEMRGRFNKIDVQQLQFDAAAKSGQIDLQIEVDSIDTGSRALDGVLKSAQWLDSKEYPLMRYQAAQFVFDGAQLQAVHGQLTLHGQTLPVSLLVRRFQCGEVKLLIFKRQVCGGDFTASISRSAFGLRQWLPEVGDEVQLQISLEAIPLPP